MRRTWDALAAGETAVYVGDPATGEAELAGLFGRLGADPRGGTCVEVGCGPGRMTGALAERFDRVVALDVSPAMLEQARANVTAAERRVPSPCRASGSRASRTGAPTRSSATSSSSTCPRRAVVALVPARVRAVCSLPAARRSSRCPCSAARLGRALARRPRPARPARPEARPAAPPSAATASRARELDDALAGAGLRVVAEDEGPSRLPLQPRPLPAARPRMTAARTRRLRRPARRERRGRLPPAAGRALPLHPRPAAAQHRHVAPLRRRRPRPRARRDPGLEGDRARDRGRRRSWSTPLRARRLPFRPNLVDWLALAYAAIVAALRRDPAERARRPRRREGDRATASATTSSSSPRTSSAASLPLDIRRDALGDRAAPRPPSPPGG